MTYGEECSECRYKNSNLYSNLTDYIIFNCITLLNKFLDIFK